MKVYYQNPFQKLTADDLNRISGANSEDSIIPVILKAILSSIGQVSDTFIGFSLNSNSNSIELGSGMIIRKDSVFKFPDIVLTPNSNALEGIYEIELNQSLTDSKALFFWESTSQTFQPNAGPTRKTNQVNLFEQWVTSDPLPSPTSGRVGVLTYKRSIVGGPLTSVSLLLPVYNPALAGVNVSLNSGIGDRSSLSNAINWIFQFIENKNYIRTTVSTGFDDAKFQVRTQGNFAFWSKDGGLNFFPFA